MENKLTVKDSSFAFLSGFIFCQFFVAVCMVFLSLILHLYSPQTNVDTFTSGAIGYLILSSTLDLSLILTFLFFNNNKHNKIFDKTSWKKLLFYSLFTTGTFLCLLPSISTIDYLLEKASFVPTTIPYTLTTKNYFISIISLAILPAICEELLFRGVIFKGLKKHGKNFSIILTSIMFSVFHTSIFQTIYPLLFGLLLGIIMYRENNITYTITSHFINNFLSLTLSFFGITLFINHWLYFIVAILLFVIFVVCIAFYIRNTKEAYKKPINKSEKVTLIFTISIMVILWVVLTLYGK